MELVYELVEDAEGGVGWAVGGGRCLAAAAPDGIDPRRKERRIACCASYVRGYFGPFQQSLVVSRLARTSFRFAFCQFFFFILFFFLWK